jgi:dolichol kinase
MVVHVIFAYSNSNYWEKGYPNYSLVIILFIANYTMQLYIIVREVKKCEGRHLGGLFYWGIIALSMLIETVAVEVTQR